VLAGAASPLPLATSLAAVATLWHAAATARDRTQKQDTVYSHPPLPSSLTLCPLNPLPVVHGASGEPTVPIQELASGSPVYTLDRCGLAVADASPRPNVDA
jgi:hypothetical protein